MTQKQFDRYIIKRRLGQGGMGTVYLANDPRFERNVALKVLPHFLLHDPNFRERFEREAKIIASLEHQAIVPVYDFGQHQGQPFLVMRLMTGGSLKDRLKENPLSLDEAKPILSRICAALDKAHAKNIIHRDLKPDNILFDEEGTAHLADFGIAKVIESTQTVSFAGTRKYMAPEQIYGYPLNGRSDVYQMGIVLFEMLTGQVPLGHQDPDAPIPSAQALNPSLPSECDTVIAKAIAKNKDDRFATAGEFATALEGVFASKAETSQKTVLTDDFKQKRQIPVWAGIITGATVLVLLIVLLLVYQTLDTQATADAQVTETATATATANATATATATASTEANPPEFLVESFDKNDHGWLTGQYSSNLLIANRKIIGGQYIWEAEALDDVTWRSLAKTKSLTDFYLTVEVSKESQYIGQQALIFRADSSNYYTFWLCDDFQGYRFAMLYNDEWEYLASCVKHPAIKSSEMNKLTVIATGSNFTLLINDQYVDQFTDDRLTEGSVGLAVYLNKGEKSTFVFDNFEVRKP